MGCEGSREDAARNKRSCCSSSPARQAAAFDQGRALAALQDAYKARLVVVLGAARALRRLCADMLDDGAEDVLAATSGGGGGGGGGPALAPPFDVMLLEAPKVRPGVLGSLDLWDLAWKRVKLVGEARNLPG